MLNFKRLFGVALAVFMTLASGCSSSGSMSGPSPLGSSGGGATISGTVGGSANSAQSVHPESLSITVTVQGTGISATVAPGESFTLNGVPAGDVVLHFTGTGLDSQVTIPAVQSQERIHVAVSLNGSRVTITIVERTTPANNGAQVKGPITSIDVPSRTIVVDGVTVSVPTDSVIRGEDHASAFADLKVGERVSVTGTFSGSTLVASKIDLSEDD